MSRSGSRRRAARGQQPRRIPDRIRRSHGADPRTEAERRAQEEFARAQMRAEAEDDYHLPTMLGEPEPLI